MSTVKVSVTLDERYVAEAKALVGERGLSRFINETLQLRLQRIRIEEWLREVEAENGPIPDQVWADVEAMDWPR